MRRLGVCVAKWCVLLRHVRWRVCVSSVCVCVGADVTGRRAWQVSPALSAPWTIVLSRHSPFDWVSVVLDCAFGAPKLTSAHTRTHTHTHTSGILVRV